MFETPRVECPGVMFRIELDPMCPDSPSIAYVLNVRLDKQCHSHTPFTKVGHDRLQQFAIFEYLPTVIGGPLISGIWY